MPKGQPRSNKEAKKPKKGQRAGQATLADHADHHDPVPSAARRRGSDGHEAPGEGAALGGRAGELVRALQLLPHPEGGYDKEVFRSPQTVAPLDARGVRSALTTIDFLLARGQFSAWHQVASDEVWHLLEGGPLRLR